MGFKTKVKIYTIRFDAGHDYHGAEARVRGMSFGEYQEATGLDGGDGDGGSASIKRFASHLVSWNLEDEDTGEPIPPTEEGIKAVDHDLVVALSNAWIQTLLGVHDADPLPETSPSGEPSRVASEIPMEPLSESLAS
ncbi:hypothetical protein [Streptomyces sp. NK08204]|uniref:hypothetical protein n=1 Tax=Streptomyces sp. NK08204 TaxID=2873260 RepID=UPI001CEC5D60|nr:hypothetical protein [Streptomyces sp. NK08204]